MYMYVFCHLFLHSPLPIYLTEPADYTRTRPLAGYRFSQCGGAVYIKVSNAHVYTTLKQASSHQTLGAGYMVSPKYRSGLNANIYSIWGRGPIENGNLHELIT